jgi:hypothetical protein
VLLVAVAKVWLQRQDLHPLGSGTALIGLVSAIVFTLGFLLSGVSADYKEAERTPSELAASLDGMADDLRIAARQDPAYDAAPGLAALAATGTAIRAWLFRRETTLADVLAQIEALNSQVIELGARPIGFVRFRTEQAAIRKAVLRIDTVRTTDFVPAGYALVKILGAVMVTVLLLQRIDPSPAYSGTFVGVVSLIVCYVYLLIRDLDNPYEYRNGASEGSDVSLAALEDVVGRIERVVG